MPKHKGAEVPISTSTRELEALENDVGETEYYDMDHEDYPIEEPARRREDRKSPAARFGSDGIGSVVLSPELQRAVSALIEGMSLLSLSYLNTVTVYRYKQDTSALRCKTSICRTGQLG